MNNNTWWLAIAALLVSIISAVFAGLAYQRSGRALKVHLDPELVCILDEHPELDHFVMFTLKNEGEIAATTVSVNHYELRFEKDQQGIRFGGGGATPSPLYSQPGVRWIYVPEIKPNAITRKTAGHSALRDASKTIDVMIFEVSFLRDTDGQQYKKQCLYFIEGDRIFSHSAFRSHDLFEQVDSEVGRWMAEVQPMFKDPRTHTKE